MAKMGTESNTRHLSYQSQRNLKWVNDQISEMCRIAVRKNERARKFVKDKSMLGFFKPRLTTMVVI